MHILEWLKANNKSQIDLAHIINRDEARAHRIAKKRLLPNEEEMLRIFTATDGEVTANDFYNLPPAPASSKRAPKRQQ